MGPADVQAFSRAAPFRPYRVRTTDGKTYDVHYPHMGMSVRSWLVIGLPDPETSGRTAYDAVDIPWDQIASVEPLVVEGAAA